MRLSGCHAFKPSDDGLQRVSRIEAPYWKEWAIDAGTDAGGLVPRNPRADDASRVRRVSPATIPAHSWALE